MYALCVSGAVNTQEFVWKFLSAIYIYSFSHSFKPFAVAQNRFNEISPETASPAKLLSLFLSRVDIDCDVRGRYTHSAKTFLLFLLWCFTSTETIRLIRDGKPRTPTSTFTQLLNSEDPSVTYSLFLRPRHSSLSLRGPWGVSTPTPFPEQA